MPYLTTYQSDWGTVKLKVNQLICYVNVLYNKWPIWNTNFGQLLKISIGINKSNKVKKGDLQSLEKGFRKESCKLYKSLW